MIREFPENPFDFFRGWLEEAEESEPNDANAMCLATADEQGRPSARMVLLKGTDRNGFDFYTNSESRKGAELQKNPHAALCFHWKTLRRQVRVEGRIEELGPEESDAYFATRHRVSRIGAWASQQSRPLDSYETLEKAAAEQEKRFEGQDDVPRPPHWHGYRLVPEKIEFWIDGPHRLHKRYLYTRSGDGWDVQMLYP